LKDYFTFYYIEVDRLDKIPLLFYKPFCKFDNIPFVVDKELLIA